MMVNVDQGQSEIVALNGTASVVATPTEETAPEKAPAVATMAAELEEKTEAVDLTEAPAPAAALEQVTPKAEKSRASNDPRQRRRDRRAAQGQQAQAAQLRPSQVPTLGQYTVGSLIRHVYGEDCSVLIEQFGLMATFNRALDKFTQQYNETVVVAVATEKKPVQELTSDDIQQSQEKNKSTNTPSKDTKAPKNKESEVIQNPDPEPEISKQDLIKYISKKHSPDSSDKMLEEKEKQEKNSKEKDEEKTSMLWDANPEVVENYWSSTLRD